MTKLETRCPSKKCECIDCQTYRAEKCYKKGGHILSPLDKTCIKCGVTFA